MFIKQTALAALLAAVAYAQTTDTSTGPIPTSSLSPCIVTCASNTPGCTYTDASCVCTDTTYQAAVLQCLQSSCTPADVTEAEGVQAALCGGSTNSTTTTSPSGQNTTTTTGTGGTPKTTSGTNKPATGTTTTSTGTSTGGSGGSGGAAGLTVNLLTTGGAVLLGVIGGGLFVF